MNHWDKIVNFLAPRAEQFPDRFWTASAMPGPRYLTVRELEMAERREEVERRERGDVTGWRYRLDQRP